MNLLARRRTAAAVATVTTLLVSLCLLPGPAGASVSGSTLGDDGAAAMRSAEMAGVDSWNRAQVIDSYTTRWLPTQRVPFSWTGGDVASCQPGTPSVASVQANVDAVNYLRSQAGVAPVTLNATESLWAQEAALVMEANNQVSHNPTESWRCWTANASDAALGSALTLGPNMAPAAQAINLYMSDPGDRNVDVGHRGAVLHAGVREVGFGLTPGANAFYFHGDSMAGADAVERAVSWPTAGYFPEGLLPGSGRWSYHTYRSEQVDRYMGEASVSVHRVTASGEVSVPVSIASREEGTLSFVPSGVLGATQVGDDVTYRVRITGVQTMRGAPAPDVEYDVTLVAAHTTHGWGQAPTIEGDAVAGATLTADPGIYTPAATGDTISYTWRSAGKVVGVDRSFTVPMDLVGEQLSVEVKVRTSSGKVGGATLASAGTIGYLSAPRNTLAPELSGTPRAGAQLWVTDGEWTPTPARLEYQWYRDSAAIPEAQESTYTTVAADYGKSIHALVTAYAPTGRSASASSNSLLIGDGPATVAPGLLEYPEITGITRVGSTLQGSTGTWHSAHSYGYQWYRDGVAIPDATEASYVVSGEDSRSRLRLRVTATNTLGVSTVAWSGMTTLVNQGAAPAPSRPVELTGRPRVGKLLRVDVPSFTPSAAKVTIIWKRNSRRMLERTNSRTYRLTRADRGARIRVQVFTTLAGYEEYVVTRASGKVRGGS